VFDLNQFDSPSHEPEIADRMNKPRSYMCRGFVLEPTTILSLESVKTVLRFHFDFICALGKNPKSEQSESLVDRRSVRLSLLVSLGAAS
jgi:hypothetical protein